jgi:chromosome segregation ATPase
MDSRRLEAEIDKSVDGLRRSVDASKRFRSEITVLIGNIRTAITDLGKDNKKASDYKRQLEAYQREIDRLRKELEGRDKDYSGAELRHILGKMTQLNTDIIAITKELNEASPTSKNITDNLNSLLAELKRVVVKDHPLASAASAKSGSSDGSELGGGREKRGGYLAVFEKSKSLKKYTKRNRKRAKSSKSSSKTSRTSRTYRTYRSSY